MSLRSAVVQPFLDHGNVGPRDWREQVQFHLAIVTTPRIPPKGGTWDRYKCCQKRETMRHDKTAVADAKRATSSRTAACLACAALLCLAPPHPAGADVKRLECHRDETKYLLPRQALVIGNAAYQAGWNDLGTSPLNDADDMAAKLCSLGFEVTEGKNLGSDAMRQAISTFGSAPAEKGVRLIYYSGHGAQSPSGSNYLIPIDLKTQPIDSGPAPDLGSIYAALDPKTWSGGTDGLLKIMILDACRAPARSLGEPREAPGASVIAYATAPGGRASAEGSGNRNSRYTGHLLKHLGAKGETLEQMFAEVRQGVYLDSDHTQLPWESSSALDTFVFEPPLAIGPVEVSLPSPDDLAEVTINGVFVARTWRDQPGSDGWQAVGPGLLHPGDNPVHVEVYNDKTYRNAWPWNPREGWRYALRLRVRGAENPDWAWSANEDVPGNGRWGAMFPVLDLVLHVDPDTGRVTVHDARAAPLP